SEPQSTPLVFGHAPTTPATARLSLHDALPIWRRIKFDHAPEPPIECRGRGAAVPHRVNGRRRLHQAVEPFPGFSRNRHDRHSSRSEEHTSELQSPYELVCRRLLEKKKRAAGGS